MLEENKNKRDKLTDSPIIFSENDRFQREIESGFQHVGGKKKKKAEMATFLSPPVPMARWALMHHFLSVWMSVTPPKIRLDQNSYIRKYDR